MMTNHNLTEPQSEALKRFSEAAFELAYEMTDDEETWDKLVKKMTTNGWGESLIAKLLEVE